MTTTGILRPLLYRMRGNNKYARMHEISALEKLSLAALRQKQFNQLVQLIRHAHATVPYYQKMFRSLGITPDDIRSFEDYTRLPVLKRQDIQEHREEMVSSTIPREQLRLNSSGGTTGHPVKFYQDLAVFQQMEGDFLYCFSLAGWTPANMIVSIWGNPKDVGPTSLKKKLRGWASGMLVLNGFQYGKAEMADWLKVIASYRRVFIYGYVSVLTDLAGFIMEKGQQPRNVHGIVTSAERLHKEQRALLQRTFNCQIHDQYGCREVPGIATECDMGGMHLLTHSAYTEFLPFADNEGPGPDLLLEDGAQPLRIVLTPLTNYAMPLLRYENGDMGASLPDPCPCGRPQPLMRMDIGRLGNRLRQLDGSSVYSSVFVHLVFTIEGVQTFQFRQTAPDEVHLYIVKNADFNENSAKKLEEVCATFPQTVCPGIALHLHYVDDVPKTAGGKHRQVVCEVE